MNKAVFKKVFIPVYTIVKSEKKCPVLITVRSVQSLSCVRLFATARTEARQASLSFTISQSLLRLMSIELMMPSNHQNPKGLDHGSKDHIFGLKH